MADAVGRLAAAATSAVDTLRGLLAAGQPATVRLGAARAILSALIDVQAHAELADRVTRLADRGKGLEEQGERGERGQRERGQRGERHRSQARAQRSQARAQSGPHLEEH